MLSFSLRSLSFSGAVTHAWGMTALRGGGGGAPNARAMSGGAASSTCSLEIEQFPCLSDNYGYLVHDKASGQTAVIDTPEVGPIMEALERKGWKLTHILNTHHHHDHAGGNLEIKEKTKCQIVGPKNEQEKIPGIDVAVGQGDTFKLGNQEVRVLDVGGHTLGHVAFVFAEDNVAFVGDSLFAMGCGRKFEGTYEQMFESLKRLNQLPDSTTVYCAHEYTLSNGKFALSVEPDNEALQIRQKEVEAARRKGEWTVPTTMAAERSTNPFLRWHSSSLRKSLGLAADASELEVFKATRIAKDKF